MLEQSDKTAVVEDSFKTMLREKRTSRKVSDGKRNAIKFVGEIGKFEASDFSKFLPRDRDRPWRDQFNGCWRVRYGGSEWTCSKSWGAGSEDPCVVFALRAIWRHHKCHRRAMHHHWTHGEQRRGSEVNTFVGHSHHVCSSSSRFALSVLMAAIHSNRSWRDLLGLGHVVEWFAYSACWEGQAFGLNTRANVCLQGRCNAKAEGCQCACWGRAGPPRRHGLLLGSPIASAGGRLCDVFR